MAYDNNEEKPIGAIWNRTSKEGRPYMSGEIEILGQKIPFVCFQNRKKDGSNPKLPDSYIFIRASKDKREFPQKEESKKVENTIVVNQSLPDKKEEKCPF